MVGPLPLYLVFWRRANGWKSFIRLFELGRCTFENG